MKLIAIFTFLLEFVGVSLILYFVYVMLLRYKVSYNFNRIFLTSIPIIALLSSVLTFKVMPREDIMQNEVAVYQTGSFSEFIDNNRYLQSDILESETAVLMQRIDVVESDSVLQATSKLVVNHDAGDAVGGDEVGSIAETSNYIRYIVISVLLLSLLFALVKLVILGFQVKNILSVKRWSTKELYKGTTIYRSGLIDGPFSFFRDIYVARSIEGDKLDMIVEHEKSHVANCHYIDKFIVELFAALMWFNPVVWVIRKEMGALHEFQADNEVVNAGVNIKNYKLYLFEELATDSPIIANGFNHSMVKKRLIMLGVNKQIRFAAIRISLASVAMVAVFISLSCVPAIGSDAVAVIANPVNEVAVDKIIVDDMVVDDVVVADMVVDDMVVADVVADDVVSVDVVVNDKTSNAYDSLITQADVESNGVEIKIDDQTSKAKLEIEEMITKTDMKRSKAELKMQEMIDKTYLQISKAELEMQEMIAKADLYSAKQVQLSATAPLSDITASRVTEPNSSDQSDKKKSDWYDLPADKVKGLPDYILFDDDKRSEIQPNRIIGITHTDKETFVDFVVCPIYDSWWCIFSSKMFLKDRRTENMYQIRRIDNDIPLNKLLVIKGHNSSYVTFTLVFPRLHEDVKIVDLISHRAPGVVYPSNTGPAWNYENIYIRDFEKAAKSKSNIIK